MKEFFDGFDMASIGQEKDQMIVGLHRGVVMRDDDLFAADYGSQSRSFRQGNVLDAPADDLRAVGIAVHDHLERFGRAAPQRMYSHHVAAPYMRKQRADRDGLRRYRDVDGAALDLFRIRGLVDQRHHLVGAQTLGEHRGKNIRLLRVGQRGKDIGTVDVFLEQQFLVRRIAV